MIFGDFNVHHKDWLVYSGGTDFSISNDLTQMVNFSTWILTVTFIVLLLWILFI